jgi:hypothetical protein
VEEEAMTIEDVLDYVRHELEVVDVIFVSLILLVVIVFGLAIYYGGQSRPCTSYGEQKLLHFQHVGRTMIPIYGRECLEREGDRAFGQK